MADSNYTNDGSAVPYTEIIEQYDPTDFFVPSGSGSEDLSVTQSFRCTTKTDRQMELFLASKKFPYVTKGDLLRHSLHRHLQFLTRLQPNVPSLMPAIEAIRDIARQQAEMAKFEQTLHESQATINKLLSMGHYQKATELVNAIYYKANEIEDEQWRKIFRDTIESKYKGFINVTGISLDFGV